MKCVLTESSFKEWWMTYWDSDQAACNLNDRILRCLSLSGFLLTIIIFRHVTTLSLADWCLQFLLLKLLISTFYKQINSCTIGVFGSSKLLVKILNWVMVLSVKRTNLCIWVFEFILDCREKLTSPSSVHTQFLSDFIQCYFFCYCSLRSSFSIASVVKCFNRFINFPIACSYKWVSTYTAGLRNSLSIQAFSSCPFSCTLG